MGAQLYVQQYLFIDMAGFVNKIGLCTAIFAFLFMLGLMFAYGFDSRMLNQSSIQSANLFSMSSQLLIPIMFFLLFIMLGFGLVLSYLKYQAWSGITVSLMAVSINIILGLMMQKFWYNTFTNNFGQDLSTLTINISSSEYIFRVHNQKIIVRVNFMTIQIALMSTISLMVAFTGFIGKIGLFESFITTIMFNIGWNLTYYVNFHITLTTSPNILFFDDFGIYSVYIYGAFFGLIMVLFLACKPTPQYSRYNRMDRGSGVLALLGTAFIFCNFLMTANPFPFLPGIGGDPNVKNNFHQLANQARINMLFALVGSVVGTYIFSAMFRCGKVGIMEAILGTISGGVIAAGSVNYVSNIAAPISIGLFAGLLCSIWYRVLYPKIFNTSVNVDSMGLFGSFLIVSIFGGVLITPTVNKVIGNLQISPNGAFNAPNVEQASRLAGLSLGYAGIAAATGIIAAIGAGLIAMVCRTSNNDDFRDTNFYHKTDFGLYEVRPEQKQQNNNQSGQQIKINDKI